MRRRRTGFTLLELLVTVALIGTIVSGATLAFGRMFKAGRLNQGADILTGALREAQVRAFQNGNLWRVSVATGDRILYLEQASDPVEADRGCGSTGWGGPILRRYELPSGVTIGLRSGECVVFGQAGRVVSRAPYVVPPDPSNSPEVVGSLPRLIDGSRLSQADLELTSFDPLDGDSGAIAWYVTEMPENLFVDLRELRFVTNICVGLLSIQDLLVRYPDHINVVASTSSDLATASWTIPLLDAPGPPDPDDGSRERRCVDFSVNKEIRFLRISLSGVRADTDDWAFDEIDLGPRFFTVQYGPESKIVEINPTTGRVTSKNG